MKTIYKAAALAITPAALVMLAPAVSAQAVQGVGVIDLEGAVAKSNAAVLAENQIGLTYRAQIDAAQAKAKVYNTELAGLRTAIEAAQKVPNPNQVALQQQVQAYQARQTFAQQDVQNMSRNFQLATAYARSQIDTKLEQAVKLAAAKKGVKILIKPDSLIFADPSADITNDVIAELNTLVPSVSTAVPAGWPNQAGAAAPAASAAPAPANPKKPSGR